MSRPAALRCIVGGCGKPIRKGDAIEVLTFGDYQGRNDDGLAIVKAWLQPGPVHMRCVKGMTPSALAELLRERRTRKESPTGD